MNLFPTFSEAAKELEAAREAFVEARERLYRAEQRYNEALNREYKADWSGGDNRTEGE